MAMNLDRRNILKGLGTAILGLAGAGAAGARAAGGAQPLRGELVSGEPLANRQPEWMIEDAARFLREWDGAVLAISKNGIVVQRPGEEAIALYAPPEILQANKEAALAEGDEIRPADVERGGLPIPERISRQLPPPRSGERLSEYIARSMPETPLDEALRQMDLAPGGRLGQQGVWFLHPEE